MNGLADFQVAHVNGDDFRQIFGQRPDLDPVQNMLQNAATGFDSRRLATSLDGHHDGDFFSGRNFVEIHMQHLAGERMMLNFLNQSQVLDLIHGKVHQNILRMGLVNKVAELLAHQLQIQWLGLPTVNGGWDAPGGAQLLYSTAPELGAAKRV